MRLIFLCAFFISGSIANLVGQTASETDSLYTKLGIKTFKVRKKKAQKLWGNSPNTKTEVPKAKAQPKARMNPPEWQIYALAEELAAPKDRIYLIFEVELDEQGKLEDLRIFDSNHRAMVDIWVQKLWQKEWKATDVGKRWVICLNAAQLRDNFKVLMHIYDDDSTDD
jgi:hypothetical protein